MTAVDATSTGGALPLELESYFAEQAEAVDRGSADVRDGLRHLADHGLLAHPEIATNCAVIEGVARHCLASAFSAWAHTMVAEYLSLSSSSALQAELPRLRRAETIGSTAMAPAMQHLVGLADLGVQFRHDRGRYVVDGAVRWASNLFAEGFLMVVGAAGPDGARAVLAIASDAPGVHAGSPLDLLALGATRSSSLRFEGVALDPSRVVSADFEPFLRAVKPRFLLLQSSFCLGAWVTNPLDSRSGITAVRIGAWPMITVRSGCSRSIWSSSSAWRRHRADRCTRSSATTTPTRTS